MPRASLTLLALKGGQLFSGTRLLFSYATGIKEPSFAESFGNGGGFPTLPNPSLKPEEALSRFRPLESQIPDVAAHEAAAPAAGRNSR